MRLSPTDARNLEFAKIAPRILAEGLLEMPVLVSERSLQDSTDKLAQHAHSVISTGYTPVKEVIVMPKRGHGLRPISVLSPTSRLIYEAIVAKLSPSLPTRSREQPFDEYKSYGTGADGPNQNDDEVRVVDLDIVAFYEYVDHGVLFEEILTLSLDPTYSTALRDLLGEIFPRGLGLPQAMNASHVIADAYLDRMSRVITRNGYEHKRYADDFRIIAPNWQSAHHAIEIAIHAAREVGLTLADSKTSIRNPQNIREEINDFENSLKPYREAAADGLRSLQFVSAGYDDFDLVEVDAPEDEVDYAALASLVDDWLASDHETPSRLARFVGPALKRLRDADTILPTDTLVKIVMRDPTRMRSVLGYLSVWESDADSWQALNRLSALPRTSPWSRSWLLSQAVEFEATDCEGRQAFVSWARGQLQDPLEVVRAEAAWFLAVAGEISEGELLSALISASEITQCGIAAAVGRFDTRRGERSKVGKAARQESPLVKAAYDWGVANDR